MNLPQAGGCQCGKVLGSTYPARRPDATAACAGRPADDFGCIWQRNPDHPAVVIAAVPEMTAERHIEHSVDDGQGAAFVLVARIEGL